MFTFFYGGVFSQWYRCRFQINDVVYNCCEQYMMASKARLFNDSINLKRIMKASQPRTQKTLGREVSNFDVNLWNEKCRDFVYEAKWAKFNQNIIMKQALLDTGDTLLVEASPTDCVWGIGLAEDDPLRLDRANWRGTNWLGEVLTKLRADIISGVKTTENFGWSKEVHLYMEMPPV